MAYPWSDIGASSPQGNARGRGPATEYSPWKNIPQEQIGARMQARDQRSIYGRAGHDVPAVSRQEIADYRPNTREVRGGNMPRQIQPWQTTLGEATEGSSSFVGPSLAPELPGGHADIGYNEGLPSRRDASAPGMLPQQAVAPSYPVIDAMKRLATPGYGVKPVGATSEVANAPEIARTAAASYPYSEGDPRIYPPGQAPSLLEQIPGALKKAADFLAFDVPAWYEKTSEYGELPIGERPGYREHMRGKPPTPVSPQHIGPLGVSEMTEQKAMLAGQNAIATPEDELSARLNREAFAGMEPQGTPYGGAAGRAGFMRGDTPFPSAQDEAGNFMRYDENQPWMDQQTGGAPQYAERGRQIGTTPLQYEGAEIVSPGFRMGAGGERGSGNITGDVWRQRTSGGSPIYEMGRGSSVQGGSILPRDVIQRANQNMRAGGGGGSLSGMGGRASDDPRYANATNQQRIAMNVAALNADTDALRSANEAKKAATHERYGMKRSSSGQGSSAGTKWWANPGGGAAMTRNRQMERAIGRAATQRERDSIRRQYTTQRGQDMDIASDAMAQAQRRQEFAGQQDYRNRQLGVDYARMEANRRAADIGYRVDERHRLEDANRAIGMERLKEGLRGQVRPQDIFTEKGPFPDMDPAAASYMIGIMKQNPNQDPIQLGKNIQAFMESNDGKWNREAFDKDFQAKMKAGRIGG